MTEKIKLLGVDPSLRNFGCVVASLDLHTREYEVLSMELIETKPQKKTKGVRKNAMDFDRCKTLTDGFRSLVGESDIVIAEMPHGSQNARAAASYGMCIGVLSHCDKPLIQVTAEQVKLAACNDRVASKKDMINWAKQRHPDAPWIVSRGKFVNKNEHLADAIAAIEAGLLTEEWRSLEILIKREGIPF